MAGHRTWPCSPEFMAKQILIFKMKLICVLIYYPWKNTLYILIFMFSSLLVYYAKNRLMYFPSHLRGFFLFSSLFTPFPFPRGWYLLKNPLQFFMLHASLQAYSILFEYDSEFLGLWSPQGKISVKAGWKHVLHQFFRDHVNACIFSTRTCHPIRIRI